jgi:hypothetical protein
LKPFVWYFYSKWILEKDKDLISAIIIIVLNGVCYEFDQSNVELARAVSFRTFGNTPQPCLPLISGDKYFIGTKKFVYALGRCCGC